MRESVPPPGVEVIQWYPYNPAQTGSYHVTADRHGLHYGFAVATDGNLSIVSAPYYHHERWGNAWIYELDPSVPSGWSHGHHVAADNGTHAMNRGLAYHNQPLYRKTYQEMGNAVDILDSTVGYALIGATGFDSGNDQFVHGGCAFLLQRNLDGYWQKVRHFVKNKGVDTAYQGGLHYYGTSVCLDPGEYGQWLHVLVGASMTKWIARDEGSCAIDGWVMGDRVGAVFLNTIYNMANASEDVTQALISPFPDSVNNGPANFGVSAKIAGDVVAIGASWHGPPTVPDGPSCVGRVYIYECPQQDFSLLQASGGSTYQEQAEHQASYRTYVEPGSEAEPYDFFGQSIDLMCSYHEQGEINEALLVVGAPGAASGAGRVYVYQRRVVGGQVNWERSMLQVDEPMYAHDRFGTSVSISPDGSRIAVGAPGKSDSRGAVYTFTRNSFNIWSQERIYTAVSSSRFDVYGNAVGLSDDRLLVGAKLYDMENKLDGHGACCVEGQVCSIKSQIQCDIIGGSWYENQPCPPEGTPCHDDSVLVMPSNTQRLNSGKAFLYLLP